MQQNVSRIWNIISNCMYSFKKSHPLYLVTDKGDDNFLRFSEVLNDELFL